MAQIVVGVDGSEHGANALRWAAGEAELREHDLVAVLVWDLFNQRHADGSRRFDPEYGEPDADAALAATLEAALGADRAARVIRRPVCDIPAPGLLGAAEDAELVVVGARGLGGFRGLLLGSVSQQVLHHAAVPVAIVRGDASSPVRGGRIVVGVDGSDQSVAALRWALVEGAARKATVEIVHVWDAPVGYGPVTAMTGADVGVVEEGARQLVDEVLAQAQEGVPAVDVERTIAPGGAAARLLDAAEGADLVVVGRRGLGGFGRLLLGSVSEHVARHAPCPVVVVPLPSAA
jgi:nucleotide-binding universal stress UspA family protein